MRKSVASTALDICEHQQEQILALRQENAEMLEMLKAMEWAASHQGAGSGPYGSGGDGPMIPACPCCGGIHPEKGKLEFISSVLGHTKACLLDNAIRKAEGR